MIRKSVTIQDNMDMEDRPVAHLVQEASQYASQVYILMGSKKINAKSIMGMMTLGLVQGQNLEISIEGEDEEEAMKEMENYLTGK